MRRTRSLLATAIVSLATASLLTACAGTPVDSTSEDDKASPAPSQGIVAGTLEVKAQKPALTLRNTTELVVGYMVVDKDQMVIALYPPCNTQCPTIVQGASVQVPYSQISGYTDKSTEAVVMWWTYRRQADGSLRPESAVQTTRIGL
ncbi:MAG: hypothetical protein IBJ03_07995 [Gemmatimonadaceae bacterium]|nr:hypothetical protein [Gemmatimonadaceae bacterium]